ncbi:type II secretion system minor pseudopilin [Diaphorobacter aerolatus]|uniref:General secretion pathway protein GspK n=1 Tax=Diaphorobacter aerolatus TaxID=1288495 RepID=A0A7H0GNU8_9BURK|nr:type II secretion system protein GspK [Diaphorobacter aerolatus]QNP49964.1 general secretion pathway protein GspK [Diaphorobacter aerolatus]
MIAVARNSQARRSSPHAAVRQVRDHGGFALIAVLWLVASLSVLVTGIMLTVKSELKVASFARQTVEAKAVAEGAMQVALQSMVASGKRPEKLIEAPVPYAGRDVMVRMTPMNGYININRAPVELLQALFKIGGGMDDGSAGNLANAILAIRTTPGPSGRPISFEAPEDLMRLPGMDYAVYARIAPLVTTDSGGSGQVNVQAAPPNVLNIVAGGNAGAVASFVQARSGDNVGADTSGMNGAWLAGPTSTKSVEMSARVPLPDGGAITVVRRYLITNSSPDGLPWRVFYADSRVEQAPSPNS